MKPAHLPDCCHSWCCPQCCPRGGSQHTWQGLSPWCWVLSSVSQRQRPLTNRPWSVQQRHNCLTKPIGRKGSFSFSLSFCLFLNMPRLAQQLGWPWLQGLCCQQCPALQPLKPRQALLSPRAGQSERMWPPEKDTKLGAVSVSEAMKYLIPALPGMCIITDLLICSSVTAAADRDDDSWHTLTQLQTQAITPEQKSIIIISAQGGDSVPDTKHRQHLHWEFNTARVSRGKGGSAGPSAPAGPAAGALLPEQPSTKGTHRVLCAPLLTWLMDQNEREVWTNSTCLGCGRVEAFIGAFLQLQMELCRCNWTWLASPV